MLPVQPLSERRRGIWKQWRHYLYRFSLVYHLFRDGGYQLQQFLPKQWHPDSIVMLSENSESYGWNALNTLAQWLNQQGKKFFWFTPRQVFENRTFAEVMEQHFVLKNFTQSRTITFIDTLPILYNQSFWYHSSPLLNNHPDESLHQRYADIVYQQLLPHLNRLMVSKTQSHAE